MEGEAEFGDFAAVTGLGSPEDLVAKAEVAVLFAPTNVLKLSRGPLALAKEKAPSAYVRGQVCSWLFSR